MQIFKLTYEVIAWKNIRFINLSVFDQIESSLAVAQQCVTYRFVCRLRIALRVELSVFNEDDLT